MNLKKEKCPACFELDLREKEREKENEATEAELSGPLALLQGSSGELGLACTKSDHFSNLDFLVCFALSI